MSDSTYKNVTHCIFDMDGLLLDTEHLYTLAYNRIANKYGKTFTWEIKGQTMGLQWHESATAIVKALDLPITPQELTDRLVPIYNELFPQARLLPDTESIYKRIYHKIVSKYGHTYGGDLAYQVLGRPELVGAELVINHYKLPLSVQQFQEQYHQMQHELFTDVKYMPGAERILRHLKENGIPIALATSSTEKSYELKTQNSKDVFALFHHRVLGGSDPEVKNGKPSPDIFLVAAQRFPDNPDPSKCLVFEDAPNGVQAAVNAGMQVIMVPDENLPKNLTEKATLVLKSLNEFEPEKFGLPAFKIINN